MITAHLHNAQPTSAHYILRSFLMALACWCSILACSGQVCAGGMFFSTAICSDGQLVGWGGAHGNMITSASTPTPLNPIFTFDGVIAVSSGIYHSVALRNDGKVFTYGDNTYGQLGVGSSISYSSNPLEVPGLSDVIAIEAGYYDVLVVLADGSVRYWGQGAGGINFSPVVVTGLTDIVAVAAGSGAFMALRADNTLWSWGIGWYGQLGQGDQITESQAPVQILTGISGIAAGGHQMMAVRTNGGLYLWGDNVWQDSGTGVPLDILWYPQEVLSVDDADPCGGVLCEVRAAGTTRLFHAAIVGAEGRVVYWGSSYDGILGQRPVPLLRVDGSAVTGARALDGGHEHMLVELVSGDILSFGRNGSGELGTGDVVTSWDRARQVINLCPLLEVGMAEGSQIVRATVHPNPCSDGITLEIPGEVITSVEILNVLGQVSMSQRPGQGTVTLDTDRLRAGAYLLKGTTGRGATFVERFMKE